MIFNNSLRTFIGCVVISSLILGCSSNPEKDSSTAEKSTSVEKISDDKNQNGSKPVEKAAIPTTILPAGPATPNPYVQAKPTKVSAQVDASFRSAILAMQQKNWSQAETILQSLAAANPTLSGVQLNLGIVYRAKNDTTKAAESFNRAITANTKNIEAYNQLALLKREAGDFAAAEILYQKALNVWPFHPESHKNIAILYELYMGKSEQAFPHYQAYQQLLPVPDKQVDSWIADLQRRVSANNAAAKNDQQVEAK